jgi:hypothetical protein
VRAPEGSLLCRPGPGIRLGPAKLASESASPRHLRVGMGAPAAVAAGPGGPVAVATSVVCRCTAPSRLRVGWQLENLTRTSVVPSPPGYLIGPGRRHPVDSAAAPQCWPREAARALGHGDSHDGRRRDSHRGRDWRHRDRSLSEPAGRALPTPRRGTCSGSRLAPSKGDVWRWVGVTVADSICHRFAMRLQKRFAENIYVCILFVKQIRAGC